MTSWRTLVALAGLVAGLAVGTGTGLQLVHILRPLFLLDPVLVLPVGRMGVVALVPLAAAAGSALLATLSLRRLGATEILRE